MVQDRVEGVPTQYWHALEDGRVQCDICPRFCKLREGQRGLCFVRGRANHQIVLTTYGRSSGYCIDPIEKKPLSHFLPGTPVLSFGTAGCNLACSFCQNWDISKSRQLDTLCDAAPPDLIAQAALSLGCRSVAFTYNDPIIFHEYAIDVAKACHQVGVKAVAVSAGYVCPEPRTEFYAHMDAVNIDLKAFTNTFYNDLCKGDLDTVLDTIRYIHQETEVWMELTTLLIPDENDSPDEITQMCRWIVDNVGVDVPIHFSAFKPDYRMLDKQRTPAFVLQQARSIAQKHGINYVYVGNVHDPDADSTYCPHCQEVVIGRDWYELSTWNLSDDGHCLSCHHPIAGVFDGPPGTWGRKRQPVQLSPFVKVS